MSKRFRIYFAIFLTVMWMISYITSCLINNFTSFELTSPVMLVVAGYIFGSGLRGNGS